MPKHQTKTIAAMPWRVPVAVEDVAETGQHFALAAGAEERASVAQMVGLRDLPRLEAELDVKRHGAGGLRVTGRVSATVGQTCVVTLEPLTNEVEEDVDLVFLPATAAAPQAGEDAEEREPREPKWDDPEPLVGGAVDLGALTTEFLILGLDPYPRKPGAVFEAPQQAEPDAGPFAALASLTKDRHGD